MVAALDTEEQDLPDEGVPEDELGLLGEHGRVAGLAWRGVAWRAPARRWPATRVPRIAPSMMSTRRALRPSGGRNAPTPASDTASMPVSDAPPLANA